VIGCAVILGGGMGGLFSALALAPLCERVVILERDPPPPASTDAAFSDWARRGASQMRHTHAFRARMTHLLRREHPDVLAQLRLLGVREQTFAETLPDAARRQYVAEPGDDDLTVLLSRRSTFELALHRSLAARPNIELRSGAFVTGLLTRRDASGTLVAEGFSTADGAQRGDIAIDAGGRTSPLAEWLEELGVALPQVGSSAGIVYFTQFFQLRPGATAPTRAAVGDLGYLKFGAIPADNGAHSITLAVPEADLALRQAAARPDSFARIVAALPGASAWIDPAVASPLGRPAGMGDLKSRWRNMAPNGEPLVRNLFSVGDSLMLTNPLYGRGCTLAAIEAHLLRDALQAHADPVARARTYAAAVCRELGGHFEDMRRMDAEAVEAAVAHLGGGTRAPWPVRIKRHYLRHGLGIAVRRHLEVTRRSLRAFHLLEAPGRWQADPRTVAAALGSLLRGQRANAGYYPPPGPSRAQVLELAALKA